MSGTALAIGIVAGALGMGYLVYGRRQAKFMPAICGALLCAYPYFIDSVVWLCVVGAALAVAPFLVDF